MPTRRGLSGSRAQRPVDRLVATLEQIDEWDRPANAGDFDRAVELDHRQPPPGRGDRVARIRPRTASAVRSSTAGLRFLADASGP
jgi:hypothetical protein